MVHSRIKRDLWSPDEANGGCLRVEPLYGRPPARSNRPRTRAPVALPAKPKMKTVKPTSRTRAKCGSTAGRAVHHRQSPHPFFQSAYGGGFTLGAGYLARRGATARSTCAAATRSAGTADRERVPGAAAVRPPRHAIGYGRMAQATSVGFTASARTTPAPTTG
jgi:hypothetical protein